MTTNETPAIAAIADEVLPVLRKAWREDYSARSVAEEIAEWAAARDKALREEIAGQIRAVGADPDRRRPLALNAEAPTDFATDFEWAAIIAQGETR